MSLEFIPTVWAARLLTALEGSLIYGQANVSNRIYEGEIREAGNTVKIGSIGDVSIGTYVKNEDIADPEVLTDDAQTLLIDQAKYTLTASTVPSRTSMSSTRRCVVRRGRFAKRPTRSSPA